MTDLNPAQAVPEDWFDLGNLISSLLQRQTSQDYCSKCNKTEVNLTQSLRKNISRMVVIPED
jgi:hypothetical protein